MPKNSPTEVTQKVQTREIKYILKGILAALRERGATPQQAKDTLVLYMSARCPQCGLFYSGRELAEIGGGVDLENTLKLRRLARGLCGQKKCGSFEYAVTYSTNNHIPWNELWQAAESLAKESLEVEESADFEEVLRSGRNAVKRVVAVILVAMAVAAVYWRVRTPAWSSRPSPYQVETNTLEMIQFRR